MSLVCREFTLSSTVVIDKATDLLPDLGLKYSEIPNTCPHELELGVYAPPRPRRVLHSEVVEFRTDTLRRRKPQIEDYDGPYPEDSEVEFSSPLFCLPANFAGKLNEVVERK